MTNPIQQEKIRKLYLRMFLIIGGTLLIFAALVYAKCCEYMMLNRRGDIGNALTYGFTHFFLLSGTAAKAMFTGNNFLYFFLVTAGVAVVIWSMKVRSDSRKTDDMETVHGRARLMNSDDLKEYNMRRTDPIGYDRNDGPNNMILSKDISLAIDNRNTRRNCNILCIGGSGAGKSRFFISPNVLQYNANFIITDPSGEMLHDYGKALEDNGYKVKVFNLVDVYKGNRYNPFHYIRQEKDAFILTNTLIKNTTPSEGHGGDPFWEKSEQLLIDALVLYLWHTCPEEDQTFSKLVDLINEANVDENDSSAKSPLDELFEELEAEDPENLAVKQYKKFKLGAGKTLKSILISVGVRLQSFDLSDIKYLTSKDEMEFETFADTRQALFIIIPTADTTFNFIVSLLYSQLFMSLYNYCETKAEFGWQAYIPMQTHYVKQKRKKKKSDPPTSGKEILKVVQADDRTDSKRAKKEIQRFVKAVKNGVEVRHNEKKHLYEVYIKYRHKNGKTTEELIGWRGDRDKKLINNLVARLKQIKAEPCRRACPNHVRFLLDEFANIGQIPEFDQKLATIRKYEISCAIVLQAISQLQQIYDKKWNTLASNCDTKLFLGSDDNETIKWLLETIGKKTVKTMSRSINDDLKGSESFQSGGEDLLTANDLTLMGEDECLVRIRGVQPYWGKKYEITNHPNYKYAHETEGTFEIENRRPEDDESDKPLRLRKHGKAVKSITKAGSGAPALSDEEKEEQKRLDARNKANEKTSQEAKEDLKNFDENASENMDDEQKKAFLASKGIDEDSTEEDIENVAMEYVDLFIPEDTEVADYQLF